MHRVKDKIGNDFRFQFIAIPSIHGDAHRRPVRVFLRLLLVMVVALAYSILPFLGNSAHVGPRESVMSSLLFGYVVGGIAYAQLLARPTSAVFLRERGMNLDCREIPWLYIHDAQWMPKRPNLLRLHRFDGDLLVNVPNTMRDDVEAFVIDRVAASGRPRSKRPNRPPDSCRTSGILEALTERRRGSGGVDNKIVTS